MTTMARSVLIVLFLAAAMAPRAARADARNDVRKDGFDRAVSVALTSLGARGMTVQYEQRGSAASWSLAGSVGLRATAGSDYSSLTMSAGAELRYWITGRTFRSRLVRAMVGPYVGARLDMARTGTRMNERAIGSAVTVAESVLVGYRFALWRRVELTPSLGLGLRTEVDTHGALPAYTRGTVMLGLTAGWMF